VGKKGFEEGRDVRKKGEKISFTARPRSGKERVCEGAPKERRKKKGKKIVLPQSSQPPQGNRKEGKGWRGGRGKKRKNVGRQVHQRR